MTAATTTRKTNDKTEAKPAKISRALQALADFGRAVGKASRISLKDSEAHHAAYVMLEGDDKARQEMRHTFVCSYIETALGVNPDKARAILAKARPDAKGDKEKRSNDEQAAYKNGYHMFAFHVMRNDAKAQARAARKVSVPTKAKVAIVKCLTALGLEADKDSLKKLAAFVNAMAKNA